jgi:beta-lactamase class A
VNGCADRQPFAPSFVSSWNASWGANHFSVGVEDRTTGCVYEFGDPGGQFPLASVAKVLIMAGTLEVVQGGVRSLASVDGLLTRMIRVSDNAAATSLWDQLGGAPAVNSVAARWGLNATVANATRGFGGTLSTAADQHRLVTEVVGGDPSPLTDAALRSHARALMTSVDPAQAWGVSAGVPAGWTVALKNGWYATQPGDIGPAGRWRVNSVGLVWDQTGVERWAIAVLGNTWPDFATGIAAIEAIAAQVATVLSAPAASVSVPWIPVPPAPSGDPAALVAIAPVRVVDTRTEGSALTGGSTRSIDLAPVAPPDATVAVTHLTAVDAQDAGYLTAFACDQGQPVASNVNYTPAASASNDAMVAMTGRQLCVYSSATTDLIVDIEGLYTPGVGLRFVAASPPQRLLDTRLTSPLVGAGSVATITVPSLDGWPPRAAFLNITADGAADSGYLTAFPADQAVPATSTVNYTPGRSTASAATVAASADSRISVYASAPVAIVVDLLGVFTESPAGSLYQPAVTQRMLDTRDGTGGWLGPLGAGQTITIPLAIPGGATAVGTLTATAVEASGYVTTWAGDGPQPTTSNLNVAPGDTIANLTATGTATDGTVAIYSQPGRHHLIYDLAGWYS